MFEEKQKPHEPGKDPKQQPQPGKPGQPPHQPGQPQPGGQEESGPLVEEAGSPPHVEKEEGEKQEK
jgi:hypothetical protein